MNNITLFLISVFLVISCTENKSVIEKLDISDVSSLLDNDALYLKIIPEIEQTQRLIRNNIVLKNKFDNLSIGDYYEYKKTIGGLVFIEKSLNEHYSKMDSILNAYILIIDKKIAEYQLIRKKAALKSPKMFFKVEFDHFKKIYYINNIFFKIIPLKGTISGGRFKFSLFKPAREKEKSKKYSNHEVIEFNDVITDTFVISHRYVTANDLTTKDAKINYKFTPHLLSVTTEDGTFTQYDSEAHYIPSSFSRFLEQDSLSVTDYKYLLSHYYNIKKEEIFVEIENKRKREVNPLAFDFENINYLSY